MLLVFLGLFSFPGVDGSRVFRGACQVGYGGYLEWVVGTGEGYRQDREG